MAAARLLYLTALLSTACTPAVTAIGTISGSDGMGAPVPDRELTISRSATALTPRMVAVSGGIQRVTGVRLEVRSRRNPTFGDTFELLSLSRFATQPGTDNPEPTLAGNANFIREHTGDLAHLRLRRDANPPTAGFTAFPIAPLRLHGRSWLVRVADADRSVPWIINAGGQAPCFPMGGGDCFDMQTLSRLIIGAAVQATTNALQQVPLPGIGSADHRLMFVPNASFQVQNLDRRFRGFTLIYTASITAPLGTARIFVPISVLFTPDGTTYTTAIDPLTPEIRSGGADVPWPNPDRILVEAEGSTVPFAGTIRDRIREGILAATLPQIASMPAEEGLSGAVHGAMGANAIPPEFDVALIPQAAPGNAVRETVIMRIPVVGAPPVDGTAVRLVFLEH